MKEETQTKAKFYLKKYAENLADRVCQIKQLLIQNEFQLERAENLVVGHVDFEGKQGQIEYYSKRVADWRDRCKKRTKVLQEIDETISQF